MNDEINIVTEQGDVELWKSNSSQVKTEMSDKLKEYLDYLKSKLD
jgi:accessory colonization factor AcfC